jgi:hypothetical protein
MIDEYPLSADQAEAIMVMHHDLGYSVGEIVSSFKRERYPITKRQVLEIVRTRPAYDPLQSVKSIYSQMVDMILGAPEIQFSPAY